MLLPRINIWLFLNSEEWPSEAITIYWGIINFAHFYLEGHGVLVSAHAQIDRIVFSWQGQAELDVSVWLAASMFLTMQNNCAQIGSTKYLKHSYIIL